LDDSPRIRRRRAESPIAQSTGVQPCGPRFPVKERPERSPANGQMLAKSRREHSERSLAIVLSSRHTTLTLREIGERCGGLDYAGVSQAHHRMEQNFATMHASQRPPRASQNIAKCHMLRCDPNEFFSLRRDRHAADADRRKRRTVGMKPLINQRSHERQHTSRQTKGGHGAPIR
jgi:hypothetical protein